MTPENLQDTLCEEIKRITRGVLVQNEGREWCDLNVYPQLTPLAESEDDTSPFPYCTVGLTNNQVTGIREPQKQEVVLYFGICYWDKDRQWQRSVLTMIERIKKRFLTDPLLGPFSCRPEMESALSDEDDVTHPYYFGGMKLTFDMPNYEREDDYC